MALFLFAYLQSKGGTFMRHPAYFDSYFLRGTECVFGKFFIIFIEVFAPFMRVLIGYQPNFDSFRYLK